MTRRGSGLMIAVSNVSSEHGVEYSRKGLQHYRVQLNQIHLAEFTHRAEDGMAVCLSCAVAALLDVDVDEKIEDHRRAIISEAIKKFPEGWK